MTAEITFDSVVTARRMRFREVPETSVTFHGHPDHESSAGSERTNLPDSVAAAVTYRDVRIDYRIVAGLRAEPGTS